MHLLCVGIPITNFNLNLGTHTLLVKLAMPMNVFENNILLPHDITKLVLLWQF